MPKKPTAKPTQSIRVVWAFLRYLATHPRGASLTKSAPADACLADPNLRVSLEDALGMLDGAVQATGDQAIGLHAAPYFEAKDRDPLEEAARNCPTVGAALECTIRYIRLLSEEATFSLEHEGGDVLFVRRSRASGTALRVASDFAMADIVQFLRRNSSLDETELSLEFAHPAPDYLGEYGRAFRCRVRFDAGRTALRLRREHLDAPMNVSCEPLGAASSARAEQLISQLESQQSLSARVVQLLSAYLSSGQVSIAWVGRRLGVSPPTLRRHLSAEGVTFSELVEKTRRELAEHELRGQGTIGEIAFRLGFGSLGAFDRAFRRWHGVLPREYRAAQLGR